MICFACTFFLFPNANGFEAKLSLVYRRASLGVWEPSSPLRIVRQCLIVQRHHVLLNQAVLCRRYLRSRVPRVNVCEECQSSHRRNRLHVLAGVRWLGLVDVGIGSDTNHGYQPRDCFVETAGGMKPFVCGKFLGGAGVA